MYKNMHLIVHKKKLPSGSTKHRKCINMVWVIVVHLLLLLKFVDSYIALAFHGTLCINMRPEYLKSSFQYFQWSTQNKVQSQLKDYTI